MLNLLTTSLIRAQTTDGETKEYTLPESMHMLWSGEIDHFPAVRTHQRHAWHSFLVQLGFIATKDGAASPMPASPQHWADLLRELTPSYPEDEPWHLILQDITKPAFMQPPSSSVDLLPKFDDTIHTPDSLDILMKANKHDLKPEKAFIPSIDTWITSLVALQTMQGVTGNSSYGISRMNKGMGSRPLLALAPKQANSSQHFQRDLKALTEHYPRLLAEYPKYNPAGPALLWTLPWDGEAVEMLSPSTLHPLYIEVCRRIRFVVSKDRKIAAIRATSRKPRTNPSNKQGDTGDPWAPVNHKNPDSPKLLTLPQQGFTYRRFAAYVASPEWKLPLMLIPTQEELDSNQEMEVIAAGMVRGQGRTHGLFTRTEPAAPTLLRALASPEELLDLNDIMASRLKDLAKVKSSVQKAICIYLDHGKIVRPSQKAPFSYPWLDIIDNITGDTFFTNMVSELGAHPTQRPDVRLHWLSAPDTGLITQAQQVLDQALDNLPQDPIHHYTYHIAAQDNFQWNIRNAKLHPALDLSTQFAKHLTKGATAPEPREQSHQPTHVQQTQHPSDKAASMAGYIAQLAQHRKGDFSEINHLDHTAPDSPVFWRMLTRYNLANQGPHDHQRWALIVKGIAIMTPRTALHSNNARNKNTTAHTPYRSVGHALYHGPDSIRHTPVYNAPRLHQLLAAGDTILQELLISLFRQMASTGTTFDWKEMAKLILTEGTDHAAAETARARILEDYYTASNPPIRTPGAKPGHQG